MVGNNYNAVICGGDNSVYKGEILFTATLNKEEILFTTAVGIVSVVSCIFRSLGGGGMYVPSCRTVSGS